MNEIKEILSKRESIVPIYEPEENVENGIITDWRWRQKHIEIFDKDYMLKKVFDGFEIRHRNVTLAFIDTEKFVHYADNTLPAKAVSIEHFIESLEDDFTAAYAENGLGKVEILLFFADGTFIGRSQARNPLATGTPDGILAFRPYHIYHAQRKDKDRIILGYISRPSYMLEPFKIKKEFLESPLLLYQNEELLRT